ncbi:MAG: Anhydro-N-acetylmuramic acid kinase, partial [Pseudomonadota bacterium]
MSGTRLDGFDAVLSHISDSGKVRFLQSVSLAFEPALKHELFHLQHPGANEIHREHLVANALADAYASACAKLLLIQGLHAQQIHAIGAHG